MNKIICSILILLLALGGVSGCAVTRPGSSISSIGAGSDTAYLNSTRGQFQAQITEDQLIQYQRQMDLVEAEMRLEKKKRDLARYNNTPYLNIMQHIPIIGLFAH
jgi:hypothetical protein